MNLRVPIAFVLVVLTLAGVATATTYEVGPGQKLSTIGDVPWEALQPGDTVLIHARAEPYKEKFVLCRAGTSNAPITVRGVPGKDGQLPVLDGNGATTRTNLDFWGDRRSVIKIGGARKPTDTMPAHIVIENLEVRSARPPYKFTGADGKPQTYVKNAAAITVEKVEHLVIRNCTLRDSGNGLFVSSSDDHASSDILVEGNRIFDNGMEGSGQEHNVYTAARGIVFQNNRLGPMRAKCAGNNLKDRSAGLVVRYNWIEGGNKNLDLVDATDSKLIRADPRYRETFVYGNVILKLPTDGHSYIVHYGGDGDKLSAYRKGTLQFFNNTVVVYRRGPMILLWFSSNEEHCAFRNNLVYTVTPGARLSLLESKGSLALSHNWFKAGWKAFPNSRAAGEVKDDGTSVLGELPGFRSFEGRDFHLTAKSPCRNAASAAGIFFSDANPHSLDRQYAEPQSSVARPADDELDIGAFEFGGK